jgi:hypothetical protein
MGLRRTYRLCWPLAILVLVTGVVKAQIDPISRSQLQIGYDQPVTGKGPQALYAYYYLNEPEFYATNLAMRVAVAPIYVDGELGIREILPHTDLGIGIAGGAFGDYYYEVRQGKYYREESFDGHGGGAAVSVYHLLNPGQLIPLNVVLRGGFRYSSYHETSRTDDDFELPEDRFTAYTRAGVRLAGIEPILFPDLAMELSAWYERQWRFSSTEYGFENDRRVNAAVDLYWLYAGLSYAWTNTGHKINIDITAGGSQNTDRFSAWRIGGVLPLVAEFPLIMPGYYFQELSAKHFVHFYGSYAISLDRQNSWRVALEAAGAYVDDLTGLPTDDPWHAGAGTALIFTSRNQVLKVAVRYGYGFNARRDDHLGAHSVGLLLQYDFEAARQKRARQREAE